MDIYDYFGSYDNYFWQWEEGAHILSIPGGSTIAYKEMLVQHMVLLSERGLPPFGSLLLIYIATNQTVDDSITRIETILEQELKKWPNTEQNLGDLSKVTSFLRMISRLPENFRKGDKRLLLLQTLFTDPHNGYSPGKTGDVIYRLKESIYSSEKMCSKEKFSTVAFHRDFSCILIMSKRFPDNEFIMKQITAVPELKEPVQLPDETTPFSRDFVNELIDNDKTFHVGSLIKRIWSGLNIPFHHSLPSEQPLGGFSDLTNKGEFDKLLVSEFANDDIIFLSRLANNEALFINREVPPVSDKTERILLMDVSLKNWGTPKLLAFAISMAIAKHPKTNIPCSAFALGTGYYPLHFSNIEELIGSLQFVDGSIDCGAGLEQFFKEYRNPRQLELIFISTAEAMLAPQLNRVISDHYSLFRYWITTTAEGGITLYKNQQNKRKKIQEMLLPLEELWKKEGKPMPANDEPYGSAPLLFPVPPGIRASLPLASGPVYLVTKEYQLLCSYNEKNKPAKGLMSVHAGIQHGQAEYEIGESATEGMLFLSFRVNTREIMICNLETQEKKFVTFTEWRSSSFPKIFFHEDKFWFITHRFKWSIEYGPEIRITRYADRNDELNAAYKKRQEEIARASRDLYGQGSVLKNLNSVFINSAGNLVLNKHELRINEHGVIKLGNDGFKLRNNPIKTEELKAHASPSGNEFVFSENSRVLVDPAGMITLISSEPSLPRVYIPSLLDASLGVGTDTEFAGNVYFLPVHSHLKIMKPADFYHSYIYGFLKHIHLYGA
ncbi:MAG: hypothetical protein JWO09_2762 [Bacteroidetes bacterium]|nr:hypothetical protein [Bacteroidota bacterium]